MHVKFLFEKGEREKTMGDKQAKNSEALTCTRLYSWSIQKVLHVMTAAHLFDDIFAPKKHPTGFKFPNQNIKCHQI